MPERSAFSNRAAAALLLVSGALAAWRALSASITAAEAQSFLDAPVPLFEGGHWLFDAISRGGARIAGPSELALRLPALLAGWACLWLIWRIGLLVFKGGPGLVALCGLFSLHPLVIDAFSTARGYSLALAFFLLAVFDCLSEGPRRFPRIGASLLLSVLSAPFFALPALVLLGAMFMTEIRRVVPRMLAAPIILCAAILLSPFLIENHSAGTSSPGRAFASMFPVPGEATLSIVLTVLFLLSALIAWIWLRRERRPRLLAWVLALGALAQVLVHFLRGVPFPLGLTALPVLAILLLLVAQLFLKSRTIAVAGLGVAAIFASSYRPGMFHDLVVESGARAAFEEIEKLPASAVPLRVAANFPLSRPLEFYRQARKHASWAPIAECTPFVEADVFVLRTDEPGMSRPRDIRIMRRFEPSGLELAVR